MPRVLIPGPKEELLKVVQDIANNAHIGFNLDVAQSERDAGYQNIALVNFIKSFGNIHNDVNDVLDVFFHHCALMMNCTDVAHAFLCFTNDGTKPDDGREIVTPARSKRINALMQTCGFYDESGEFAFTVGLPGKSGVGGGVSLP